MTNVSKAFSPALFAENDKICRAKLREILKDTKFVAVDNTNKRGVDMLCYHNGELLCFLELARKSAFTSTPFAYPDVNIESRKAKYLKMDRPTFIIMFSKELDNYMILKDKDILNSPLVEVSNRYIRSGELFYKCDISKITYNNLEEELKKLIK